MKKRDIRYTSQFKKDAKALKARGNSSTKIREIVSRLSNDEPLPESKQDHPIKGNWSGFRECHVEPDLILIYRLTEDDLILVMVRIESHSELFRNTNVNQIRTWRKRYR